MNEMIIRYLHFIGIMGFTAMLLAEHLLLAAEISIEQLKKIAIIDAVLGVSAGLVFVAGLSMWLWVGKPSEFYSSNWIFHIKVSIFLVIFLLSIYPTRFFIKNRKNETQIIHIPKKIIMLVRLELVLLVTLPFLAILMARGYGLE